MRSTNGDALIAVGSASLGSVTLSAPTVIRPGGGIAFLSAGTLAAATVIRAESTPTSVAIVRIGNNATLNGGGEIQFSGSGDRGRLAAGTSTLGAGITLRTAGAGFELGDGSTALRILGSVISEEPNKAVAVTGTVRMDGTLTARTGGLLSVNSNGTMTIGSFGLVGIATDSFMRVTGTLVNNGTIDALGPILFDYTTVSPFVGVRGQLATGYAGGAWTGKGIRNSLAADDPDGRLGLGFGESTDIFATFPATFYGQTVDSSAVLVATTLMGDANLDGTVNAVDFSRMAAAFGLTVGQRWTFGDFNYDGAVGIGDFAILARNFNQTISPPLSRNSGAAVPEPGMGAAFFILGSLLMRARLQRWSR